MKLNIKQDFGSPNDIEVGAYTKTSIRAATDNDLVVGMVTIQFKNPLEYDCNYEIYMSEDNDPYTERTSNIVTDSVNIKPFKKYSFKTATQEAINPGNDTVYFELDPNYTSGYKFNCGKTLSSDQFEAIYENLLVYGFKGTNPVELEAEKDWYYLPYYDNTAFIIDFYSEAYSNYNSFTVSLDTVIDGINYELSVDLEK